MWTCESATHTPVVLLRAVCITKVAEVVVPAQVFQQLVIIEVSVIAELTEGVASVTGVIRVSVCSVTCQLLTIIPLPLIGEDLEGEVRFKVHRCR